MAESIEPSFLTSALDGGESSTSRPSRFTLEEGAPGTHEMKFWVGPRAGLDVIAPVEIRTPAVQPVASHYTDRAIANP
jgi:hypothetical protein